MSTDNTKEINPENVVVETKDATPTTEENKVETKAEETTSEKVTSVTKKPAAKKPVAKKTTKKTTAKKAPTKVTASKPSVKINPELQKKIDFLMKNPTANFETEMDETLRKKVSFLKNNPDAHIVIYSDNERGSASNLIYSNIGTIDSARIYVNDVLNFKAEVKDHDAFMKEYTVYSKNNFELMNLLKTVSASSIEMLKQLKKPYIIKNGMLRSKVEGNDIRRDKRKQPTTKKVEVKK